MSTPSVYIAKVTLYKRVDSHETEMPGIQSIPVYACRLTTNDGNELCFDLDSVEVDIDKMNCAATVHITGFNFDINLDKVQIEVE